MDVPRPSSKIVGMTPVNLCLNVRDHDCDHEFHHDCDHDCDHVSRVMVILMAEAIGIAQQEAGGSDEVFGKGGRYCGKGRRFKPKMGAMAYIGYMFPMSPKVGELLLDGRFQR